jgi:hypothetical protein
LGGFVVIITLSGAVSIDLLLLMHVSGLALPRNATRPLSSSLDCPVRHCCHHDNHNSKQTLFAILSQRAGHG